MSAAENVCYVYTLAYPNGTVFYVGEGSGNRINNHEHEAARGKKSPKCDAIRHIWAMHGQVLKRKVQENMRCEDARALEKELIRIYGRENLTNRTNG